MKTRQAQCACCDEARLSAQCDRLGTKLCLKKQYLALTAAARVIALTRVPNNHKAFFEKPKVVKKQSSERQNRPGRKLNTAMSRVDVQRGLAECALQATAGFASGFEEQTAQTCSQWKYKMTALTD